MKISKIKKERRKSERAKSASLKIIEWGNDNSFPTKLLDIVYASATGKKCLNNYARFVEGMGFADEELAKFKVNKKDTANDLLNKVVRDYTAYGAFAIHVNFNMLYEPASYSFVPLENVRLSIPDDNGNINSVRVHEDWAKEDVNIRRFNSQDIEDFDLYNPELAKQEIEEKGIENYNGQIFLYSNQGEKTYPIPIYEQVLADMGTERAVSNVLNRNASNGFFSAGLVVEIKPTTNAGGNEDYTAEDGQDNYDPYNSRLSEENSDLENVILQMQGDDNAAKVACYTAESKEDIPIFVPMESKNYDKQFEFSSKYIKSNIGESFTQPPILRGEAVASNFGSDLMAPAYEFYNTHTQWDRNLITRVFAKLFEGYKVEFQDFKIQKLIYDNNG